MALRLIDFLSGLSGALDLISPEVVGHHKRVAYVAVRLARVLGLPRSELTDLYMAGIMHDVGGFSVQSRLAALQFEADGFLHAELGYRLLRKNPLLHDVAPLVQHHHTPYARFDALAGHHDGPPRSLLLANVLCMADRVDVLFIRRKENSPGVIMERLRALSGVHFAPEIVQAMAELAGSEHFWVNLASEDPTRFLAAAPELFDARGMSRGQLMAASQAFSQIIDFRSRFTATHTRGVAETAVCLAELAGFGPADLDRMRLAGNLHDLGKLAVPAEILDKPGPLDNGELAVMRRHPELARAILGGVSGLEQVSEWASQHHEQPGGRGYPEGRGGRELSLGSRILAVADVFTALREDRPYRAGMDRTDTLRVLGDMAARGALDPVALSLLRENETEVNERRSAAQTMAAAEFQEFYAGVAA